MGRQSSYLLKGKAFSYNLEAFPNQGHIAIPCVDCPTGLMSKIHQAA